MRHVFNGVRKVRGRDSSRRSGLFVLCYILTEVKAALDLQVMERRATGHVGAAVSISSATLHLRRSGGVNTAPGTYPTAPEPHRRAHTECLKIQTPFLEQKCNNVTPGFTQGSTALLYHTPPTLCFSSPHNLKAKQHRPHSLLAKLVSPPPLLKLGRYMAYKSTPARPESNTISLQLALALLWFTDDISQQPW